MNTFPPNLRIIDNLTGGTVISAGPINCYSALSIPAYRRAIEFLSVNLAAFPRTVRKNGEKRAPEEMRHPIDDLLELRPNGYQSATVLWTTLFMHAAHTNNGFAEITRDPKTFKPVAIHNLKPDCVTPFRIDREDGRGLQQYFAVDRNRVVLGSDMIHLARLSWDGMTGMDPVQLHEGTLKKAALLGAYTIRYLERGAVISGAIEFPADTPDEQIDQVVDLVRRFYSGADAERDLIILSGGAKLNNAGLSPQDSQLVEQDRLSTKQIAQITGVPPHFLFENSESKYVNTVEQAGIDVVRFTFRPWLSLIEDELTLKLLTIDEQRQGLRVHVDPDALLRGDTKAQAEVAIAKVKNKIATPNEGRAELGLPRSDDPEAERLTMAGDTAPPQS